MEKAHTTRMKYLYLHSAHQFLLPFSTWWDHETCLLLGNICAFFQRPQLLNTSSPSSTPFCANRNFSNISSSSSTLRRFLNPREGLRKATGIAAARTPTNKKGIKTKTVEKKSNKSHRWEKWEKLVVPIKAIIHISASPSAAGLPVSSPKRRGVPLSRPRRRGDAKP